ncbi:hypothetical protein [Gordoniibacillus kamchatkensis]|uniref:hypothetical protein n=1 Tax=Gordoniibacillus kamchatkensis TaxID=1590651 RepID=UPI000B2021E5|nr:hypothetical protein [Paenibacillus sp. VKM B-2647]
MRRLACDKGECVQSCAAGAGKGNHTCAAVAGSQSAHSGTQFRYARHFPVFPEINGTPIPYLANPGAFPGFIGHFDEQ